MTLSKALGQVIDALLGLVIMILAYAACVAFFCALIYICVRIMQGAWI